MGLCLAMIGLGYYVASALASIVKHASDGKWYPDNLNEGSLECYMFLLTGLMLVNTVVFVLLAVKYRYADQDQKLKNLLKDSSQSISEIENDPRSSAGGCER